jgi:hypothetical protein
MQNEPIMSQKENNKLKNELYFQSYKFLSS